MVDTKKEQEREELHRAIWQSPMNCEELLTDGTSKTMCWVQCSTVISLKISQTISMPVNRKLGIRILIMHK